MNKKQVDALIPAAIDAIKSTGISEDGIRVPKAFRAQISAYGAAISMGSLLAATAFFSQQGNASVPRERLLDAINRMLPSEGEAYPRLIDRVRRAQETKNEKQCKQDILHCAVALKLAMNVFELVQKEPDSDAAAETKEGSA